MYLFPKWVFFFSLFFWAGGVRKRGQCSFSKSIVIEIKMCLLLGKPLVYVLLLDEFPFEGMISF